MGKCLVTKLAGAVTGNNNLLRLGEMRIKVGKVSDPTSSSQCFGINVTQDTKLEIIGDGYFTDSSLAENKGKELTVTSFSSPSRQTKVYYSNSDIEIAVLSKYAISNFQLEKEFSGNLSFDVENLKYSKSLTYINSTKSQIYGDIINFKDLTNLVALSLDSTQVYGDIANISKLTNLSTLKLRNTQVYGDISNFANLTNLSSLGLEYTKVQGDISFCKNFTNLSQLSFKGVSGIFGDLGILPDNILFFSSDKGAFTWNTSSRTYIIAMEKIKCDKIDTLLNDMATKTAKFGGEESWWKTISLIGSRTSASDAAVQTLQSKGYTVSITPA